MSLIRYSSICSNIVPTFQYSSSLDKAPYKCLVRVCFMKYYEQLSVRNIKRTLFVDNLTWCRFNWRRSTVKHRWFCRDVKPGLVLADLDASTDEIWELYVHTKIFRKPQPLFFNVWPNSLDQCFPNLSWRTPVLHILYVSLIRHPIQFL